MQATLASVPSAALLGTKSTEMQFVADPGLYFVPSDTHWLNILNQINSRQSHLEAMLLIHCLDDGSAALDSMSAEARANYLHACWSASAEIGELTKLLVDAMREPVMQ